MATCYPGSISGSGATSPIRVNGLTNGRTYSCVVRAVNNGAAGAPSGSVTVTPTDLNVITTAPSIVFGGTMNLSTSGGFGTGAVTYAVATGGANSSISRSTLTGNGEGNCTVTATKAGDRPTTISILRANQATLTAVAAAAAIGYRGATTLSTTGGSGTGSISYAVATGDANCSVNGTTWTGLNIGTCTVTATKLGDSNYNLAVSAPIDVRVGKATQAPLTAVAANTSIGYGQTTTLSTTGGNGTDTVSYAVATGGSITGNTLAATAASSCTVVSTKATDTNYTQASSTAITITVGKATQTALTTPVATPSTVAYGATATLSTSGGSGTGALTYSVATGGANCSISGTTLTVTAVGNCTVVASKAADSNYYAATSSARTVYVTKATQATLTAVAVTYAVTAGGANCTLIGSKLTGKAVGTCTVTATKAGDSNYNAARAGVTFTVQ